MFNERPLIRQVIESWLRATANNDIETIMNLMAGDVIFLRPGQAPMRGKQAFADAFTAGVGKYRIESVCEPQEIQVDGNLAFCWSQMNVTVAPLQNGAPMHLSGTVMSVFRKQADGRWLISRDANMLTPSA